MVEVVDQGAAARHVAAQRADGFRQRADLDVDAAVHPEMIDRSAAVLSEDAAGVRIVHHHDAAELLGQRTQLWQRAEVAVHAEHAVRDQQLALVRGQILQHLAGGVHVLVRKHLDRGAAQPRPVDDAGVIQFVRHHHVVSGQDGGDRAGVRRKTALENDHCLSFLEGREPALELHVNVHGAGDGSDRSRAHTQTARRVDRRFAKPGMRRESEVVVGGQVHHLPAVERGLCLLFAAKDAKTPVESLLFEQIELCAQKRKRIDMHG